jgi:hypothetical protein
MGCDLSLSTTSNNNNKDSNSPSSLSSSRPNKRKNFKPRNILEYAGSDEEEHHGNKPQSVGIKLRNYHKLNSKHPRRRLPLSPRANADDDDDDNGRGGEDADEEECDEEGHVDGENETPNSPRSGQSPTEDDGSLGHDKVNGLDMRMELGDHHGLMMRMMNGGGRRRREKGSEDEDDEEDDNDSDDYTSKVMSAGRNRRSDSGPLVDGPLDLSEVQNGKDGQ